MNTQIYFEEYDKEYISEVPNKKIVDKEIDLINAAKKDRKKAKRKIDKLKSINNKQPGKKIIDVTKSWKRQFFETKRKQIEPTKTPILGTQFKSKLII